MAKKKKSRKSVKPVEVAKPQSGSVGIFLEKYPNFLPLFILFVLLLVFFNEVMFGGKTFLPPDTLSSKSITPFVYDAIDRGIYPLWNPYIYSGMPSFASLQSAPFVDLLGTVIHWVTIKFLGLPGFTRILFNYFLLGVFTYILLLKKTKLRLVALFAAIAMVFQPPVIAFTAFGHNTKIATAVFIPILFLLLDELLEKRQLHYFALLALAVGLQLLRAHTQIAYYTLMMLGLYVLFWIINSKIKKVETVQMLKSLGLVSAAFVIGIAMSSWLYLSVLEYADYSIRGGGTGLDYGYATNWSFAPKQMITFFIPSFLGFGGGTYWGEMPFTDFPQYMGIVTLFLAGIAFLHQRDKYVIFFGILAALSLFVAFGKHLPILYTPLFNVLPFFNKFRVPSMILILLQFSVVVLAGLGLQRLLNLQDASAKQLVKKYTYIFAGACGVLALFVLFAKSAYVGWAASSVKQLSATALESAYETTAADSLKMILMVGVTSVLTFIFLGNRLKNNSFMWAMIAVVVVDLWWVGFKITNPRPEGNADTYFAQTDAVKFLKQDDEPYRVFAVADNKPANWYAYHKIQNIMGYQTARLKIYQDFLEKSGLDARNRFGLPSFLETYFDVVMNNGQPMLQPIAPDQIDSERRKIDNAILDMLNVKYLISSYPFQDDRYKLALQARPSVIENTGVLPRAYFVDEIKVLANDDAFFQYLKSGQFEPAKEAVLTEPPEFEIVSSQENRVEVTSYDIHEINLKAEVAGPALLVLSEIYYPAGWQAFVDGAETKIYRTNTILRSIFLEPGEHDIRFVFAPKAFKLGVWLTFGILFGLLAILMYTWKFKSKNPATSSS